MRLRVVSDLKDGNWKYSTAYIDDGQLTYFLDPNKPRSLRFKPNEDTQQPSWPAPFAEVDLDRVSHIHRLLTEAAALGSKRRYEEDR